VSERSERGEGVNHLGHRLSGYLDGELRPPTAELVAAHLAGCPACRVAAADQWRVKGDLRELGGPPPPPGLLDSLLQLPRSDGSAGAVQFAGFPTAPVGTRKRPVGMPLFAAGVAGVAALTVASAVFTGAAPQRVHHTARPPVAGGRVRTQADISSVGHSVVTPAPTPATARQPEGPQPIAVPLSVAVELVRGPG
jgi:anti-sigma factor RsiW